MMVFLSELHSPFCKLIKMKLIVKFFLFLFAASILMTVVFFLRISPSIKIWENYKILYFPAEYKNTEIKNAIGNADFLNQI